MKLLDLNPQFITYHVEHNVPTQIANDVNDIEKGTHEELRDQVSFHYVDTLTEAQGIDMLCPLCFKSNNGTVGTHGLICWFADRGIPDDADPKPGRWVPAGTGYQDLSFVGPAAASVLLMGGCNAHFFIKNGEIIF